LFALADSYTGVLADFHTSTHTYPVHLRDSHPNVVRDRKAWGRKNAQRCQESGQGREGEVGRKERLNFNGGDVDVGEERV